jgi:hypothetical protein
MTTAFSLPYLGSIGFYACYIQAENPVFDIHEHFIKQTPRNRCFIESPDGLTKLTIPLEKSSSKLPIKDLHISYREEWQKDHWRSICSSYNSSAFFQFYDYLFEEFYTKQFNQLIEYNLALHELIMHCLKINLPSFISSSYIENPSTDYRLSFNHKDPTLWEGKIPHYHQVFHAENKAFIPNLSIIDLLFNEGPQAIHTLEQVRIS